MFGFIKRNKLQKEIDRLGNGLESGEITREDYDNWRCNYPRHAVGTAANACFDPETGTMKTKVLSPEGSDLFAAGRKKKKKK